MNVWHICIVNHLSKKVTILLFVWSSGVICTKQGASISSHSFPPLPLGLNAYMTRLHISIQTTCKRRRRDVHFCLCTMSPVFNT